MKSSYQPIIGVEVHAELNTKSKMFCRCVNDHFQVEPNTQVCPVCLGMPGALPVPNQKAINKTILIALALNCEINHSFWFDRKNYFYPDLPKGYQISQHFSPIGVNGEVPILVGGKFLNIGINDVHLEEDTGKLIHQDDQTLIDFNRSGVPLVEIVSAPDLHSAEQTKIYLKRLQQTLRWLSVSDCDMEKGSMRLEANISVRNAQMFKNSNAEKIPDYRVEVKNLNSFRFVEKAIDYEVERQIKLLESGKQPRQETRGFDSDQEKTFVQRGKEVAKDYRYFPEPDIPPFSLSNEQMENVKCKIDTLPWGEEKKIIDAGVRWKWAEIIARDKKIIDLFWQTVKADLDAKDVANYIVNNPLPEDITSEKLAKKIKSSRNKFDLTEKEIKKAVEKAVADNPQAVEDYQAGKKAAVGFLIGQVMKLTSGRADPNTTRKFLIEKLDSRS
jgi:aspartyl-tRNA(Asn)/glutamyl-tRNA(Gln) amidotransferase subunit B